MSESMQPVTGPVIVLETERLRLRRFVPGDVDRLVELDSDREVMRYISFGLPTPRERYEQQILPRWFALYAAAPLLGYWAAETRVVGPGPRNQGSLAVLAHGFECAGAETISARTLAGNAASQRVMQKCGLRFAGRYVYAADVIPGRTEAERAAVKYSLKRSEWQARQV